MNSPLPSSTTAPAPVEGRLQEHIVTLIGAAVALAYLIEGWVTSGEAPAAPYLTAAIAAVVSPVFGIIRYRRQVSRAVSSTIASIVLPSIALTAMALAGGCATTAHQTGRLTIDHGPPCVVQVHADGRLVEELRFDRCEVKP